MLTTPGILVGRPHSCRFAVIRLGAQLWQQVQEERHQEQEQDERNDAHADVGPDIAWHSNHLEVTRTLSNIRERRLLLVIPPCTNVGQNPRCVIAWAASGSATSTITTVVTTACAAASTRTNCSVGSAPTPASCQASAEC